MFYLFAFIFLLSLYIKYIAHYLFSFFHLLLTHIKTGLFIYSLRNVHLFKYKFIYIYINSSALHILYHHIRISHSFKHLPHTTYRHMLPPKESIDISNVPPHEF